VHLSLFVTMEPSTPSAPIDGEASSPTEEPQKEDIYGYNEPFTDTRVEDSVRSTTSRGKFARRVNNVTAEKAPFDVSYHPRRILLYAPPRQRRNWDDSDTLPRINWGDLFFDLFYVAATYNVSNILTDSPTWRGLLYAAATFLPIMAIWSQRMVFDSRYVTEADIVHVSKGPLLQRLRFASPQRFRFSAL
jgi:Bacterial low temperature requirement A protein (LtrA)